MKVLRSYLTICNVSFFTVFFLYAGQTQANNTKERTPFEKLVLGSKLAEFKPGSGVIFVEQNPSKLKIIRFALSKFRLSEIIIADKETNKPTHYLFSQRKIKKPQIEFRKINPTKYRLRIHGANGDFPIIFSETFNSGWKAYLLPWTSHPLSPPSKTPLELLSKYNVSEENMHIQASSEVLKDFLSLGWVTELNKNSNEITLDRLVTDLKNIGKPEKANKIEFISKNYFGSIQNNNLPANQIQETWFPRKIIFKCVENEKIITDCLLKSPLDKTAKSTISSKALQWPDSLHWEINSFANSWWIKTSFIRSLPAAKKMDTGYYQLNSNGTIDFEMVLEFWPQRLFYMGGIFSISLFFLCVAFLFLRSSFRLFNHKPKLPHQTIKP